MLTEKQKETLVAFHECFDLYTDGAWAGIEKGMRNDFGIENPEEDLADALEALKS